MKWLPLILIVAIGVIANCLSSLLLWFFDHALSTDYSHTGDLIADVLWISSMGIAIVIAIVNRKFLFKGYMILLTLLAFCLCTPFPFVVVLRLLNPMPDTVLTSSDHAYPPGKVLKTDHWQYGYSDHKFVDKLFIVDSADFAKKEEAASFKPESKWVYLSENGDTLRTEVYMQEKRVNVYIPSKNHPAVK